jgi:transposase
MKSGAEVRRDVSWRDLNARSAQCGETSRGERVMFSYVDLEYQVPDDHPLRAIRHIGEAGTPGALTPLRGALRRQWPPLDPARAAAPCPPTAGALHSERQFMEQLHYSLLFRWFVGLGMDAPVWHPTSFSKNRDRLLAGQFAGAFFTGALRRPGAGRSALTSRCWPGPVKRVFRRTDAPPSGADDDSGNPMVSFRSQRRSNATHRSVTDPPLFYQPARRVVPNVDRRQYYPGTRDQRSFDR